MTGREKTLQGSLDTSEGTVHREFRHTGQTAEAALWLWPSLRSCAPSPRPMELLKKEGGQSTRGGKKGVHVSVHTFRQRKQPGVGASRGGGDTAAPRTALGACPGSCRELLVLTPSLYALCSPSRGVRGEEGADGKKAE